jgi:signal transduction histidine kinase
MTYGSALLNPKRWLLLALVYNLLAIAGTIGVAIQQPWLGLELRAAGGGSVQIVSSQGPSASVPKGAQLLAIADTHGSAAIPVQPQDLMEEPDVVARYPDLEAFFAQQQRLSIVLAQPQFTLQWQEAEGNEIRETLVIPIPRPLFSLPALFWFQLAISVTGCLIAVWVWVLRPRDWGVRMFGLTGLLFPLFVMPAAIYSGRELALPGGLFAALSSMNHGFAYLFGAATACIFACYPRPLLRPLQLLWVFGVFSLWGLTDLLRLAPDLDWGNRFLVTAELLLCMLLATIQWIGSRGAPLERASLRWLFLSLLLGSGLFILTSIITVSLGWLPPMPQGYAFGFFMLIYIGIALGLRRYRLFDLDQWAYRLLMWVGGALAVVGLDATLILALDWSAGPALGVSLWVCGFLYFPVRQWLWQKLADRPQLQLHELMPDIVSLAFQPSQKAQETAWDQLLMRLFDPLELSTRETGPRTPATLDEQGLSLLLPACGGVSARQVRYPERGRRLFSRKDVTFIHAVCNLMDQAQESRDAQDRGVREERRRIARDMHDDVGARLLMLIHRAQSSDVAELARAAMNDLRTALAALDARPVPLTEALADWRAEASSRCEAAGVALRWQAPKLEAEVRLSARHKSLLERTLRESLTNALKHASPTWIHIRLEKDAQVLSLQVKNDGTPTDPQRWQEGLGLSGMRQRLGEVGADLRIERLGSGETALRITLPWGKD